MNTMREMRGWTREEEVEWLKRMIAMEEKFGTFPPNGASGGAVANNRRQKELEEARKVRPEPCENNFEKMAKENAHHLALWVLDDAPGHLLPDPLLTFALEHLGRHATDKQAVRAIYRCLWRTKSIVVKEGALYGLSHHLSDSLVYSIVRDVSQKDEHEAIRECAQRLLEDVPVPAGVDD